MSSAKIYHVVGGGADNSTMTSAAGTVAANLATTSITGDVWWDVKGTFASTTVTLQAADPNGVFQPILGSPTTSAEQTLFSFPQYSRRAYRVGLTQSSSAYSLAIWLAGANN
jgi:hypothetical protein